MFTKDNFALRVSWSLDFNWLLKVLWFNFPAQSLPPHCIFLFLPWSSCTSHLQLIQHTEKLNSIPLGLQRFQRLPVYYRIALSQTSPSTFHNSSSDWAPGVCTPTHSPARNYTAPAWWRPVWQDQPQSTSTCSWRVRRCRVWCSETEPEPWRSSPSWPGLPNHHTHQRSRICAVGKEEPASVWCKRRIRNSAHLMGVVFTTMERLNEFTVHVWMV